MKINSIEFKKLISKSAVSAGFEIDDLMVDQLTRHAEELLTWNKKTNLTAITDPFEVAVKHIIDSLLSTKYIPENSSLLDIGTGGGFPGIPIKIIKPSTKVSLVDSSRKKVSFLKHVIRTLKLKDIEAVHSRGEELSKKESYKNNFDYIICRAFSDLTKFISIALPFLKIGGVLIAMKGKRSDYNFEIEELKKISIPEYPEFSFDKMKFDIKNYELPHLKAERSIIIISFNQ